jgi:hypothetical protein
MFSKVRSVPWYAFDRIYPLQHTGVVCWEVKEPEGPDNLPELPGEPEGPDKNPKGLAILEPEGPDNFAWRQAVLSSLSALLVTVDPYKVPPALASFFVITLEPRVEGYSHL